MWPQKALRRPAPNLPEGPEHPTAWGSVDQDTGASDPLNTPSEPGHLYGHTTHLSGPSKLEKVEESDLTVIYVSTDILYRVCTICLDGRYGPHNRAQEIPVAACVTQGTCVDQLDPGQVFEVRTSTQNGPLGPQIGLRGPGPRRLRDRIYGPGGGLWPRVTRVWTQ